MNRTIFFTLPFALETLNVRDRKHMMQRTHDKGQMRLEIIAALSGTRNLPRPPFARARINIVRFGLRMVDPDGLGACAKNLLDCLCIQSKLHPTGLGVLVDDSPKHIELSVTQAALLNGMTPHTTVRIDELPDLPPEPAKKRKRVKRRATAPSGAALRFGRAHEALGRKG